MKNIILSAEETRLTSIAIREYIQTLKDHNVIIQTHGTDQQINDFVTQNNTYITILNGVLNLLK